MTLSLQCYAKINLFLEVLKKRPDGFHEIFTLYQALECGDTLEAEPASEILLRGAETVTKNSRDNLIYKAAKIMQKQYSPGKGIHFNLKKVLPTGAGLGGGSSDCAAAIHLCSRIWELNLSSKEMLETASLLGSDVPFFLFQRTAFGLGTGAQIKTAPPPKPFHVLIATPAVSINTKIAYSLLASSKTVPEHSQKKYHEGRLDSEYYRGITNDFEPVLCKEHPEIKEMKDEIEAFSPVKAMLSGSGSSLFALFENLAMAEKCAKKIHPITRFQVITRFAQK